MKKKILSLSIICLVIFSLTNTSCSKSNDPAPTTCAKASSDATAASTALQAYIADPTPAKCQAAKKAYSDFLDAAKGCSTISKTDISAAQEAVDSLC